MNLVLSLIKDFYMNNTNRRLKKWCSLLPIFGSFDRTNLSSIRYSDRVKWHVKKSSLSKGRKRADSSLASMAISFPAQAARGAVGAKGILLVMPTQYKHILKGPSLKVDLHTGATAEGVLTFGFNLVILFIMLKGPKNPLLMVYLVAVATVALVIPGSRYTGPSMNPANAFGWAYMYNKHNTWEHFYVYWVCPFVGAILAGLLYRFLFISPPKQKKA